MISQAENSRLSLSDLIISLLHEKIMRENAPLWQAYQHSKDNNIGRLAQSNALYLKIKG